MTRPKTFTLILTDQIWDNKLYRKQEQIWSFTCNVFEITLQSHTHFQVISKLNHFLRISFSIGLSRLTILLFQRKEIGRVT